MNTQPFLSHAKRVVCKVGGTESDNPVFLKELASWVHRSADQCVVVHGGGKDISSLQSLMGIPVEQVNGLRVTPPQLLPLLDMTLSGLVNKRVVRAFLAQGVKCVGLSGSDGALLVAQRLENLPEKSGFVGKVTEVNTDLIIHLLGAGFTPIVAPVAVNSDFSHVWNINADHAALALALRLKAHRLEFLTNVPGVLRDQSIQPRLSAAQAQEWIQCGVISGGMIPKVQSALDAVAAGIPEVVIRSAGSSGTVFFDEGGVHHEGR